jgi:hypothetical protein
MRPLLYIRYLAVPARPVPLLMIVAFAFGLTLASNAWLFGVPLALILISWTFKYAFVAFDSISRGYDEPPVLSLEMMNPADEQRPLGMLLIVGVFLGATAAAKPFIGPTATSILRYGALFFLPAAIAALGITSRIIDAINPKLLIEVIRRLRIDYPILLAVIALYGVGIALLSRTLWDIAQFALLLFGILSLFCLLGGIIYQRRHALGFDAWKAPERIEEREQAAHDRAVAREVDDVYSHWRSGNHVEAWQELEKKLAARKHDLDAYRRYYPVIAQWPDPRLANHLARDFISRLLDVKRSTEALRILRERLAVTADFRPAKGAQLVRLVHIARASGDRATARTLLSEFERHFPNDAAQPVVEQMRE